MIKNYVIKNYAVEHNFMRSHIFFFQRTRILEIKKVYAVAIHNYV